MAKKKSFQEKFYKTAVPKLVGLGASVVIIGALFKIQHWEGGGPIISIGLITEAFLFALLAFAPQHDDPDWTKVYPQLKDDHEGGADKPAKAPDAKGITAFSDALDKVVKGGSIDKIEKSFKNLNDSVNKIGDVTSVSVASKDYASKIKEASGKLTEMNSSYGKTVEAMSELSNASQDAKKYHEQVQNITKNLSSLNAVYEMELQDANSHLKALNKFYSNLSSAMENMSDASKDTEQFKTELGKLTNNLTSLNSVYGSMLAAMRGGNKG